MAIELNSANTDALMSKVIVFLLQEENNKAIECFDKVIELNP